MKKGMKKRCELGKKSSYLLSLKRKNKRHSDARQSARHIMKPLISSTKIAKSSIDNPMIFRTNKFLGNVNRKGIIVDKAA